MKSCPLGKTTLAVEFPDDRNISNISNAGFVSGLVIRK